MATIAGRGQAQVWDLGTGEISCHLRRDWPRATPCALRWRSDLRGESRGGGAAFQRVGASERHWPPGTLWRNWTELTLDLKGQTGDHASEIVEALARSLLRGRPRIASSSRLGCAGGQAVIFWKSPM